MLFCPWHSKLEKSKILHPLPCKIYMSCEIFTKISYLFLPILWTYQQNHNRHLLMEKLGSFWPGVPWSFRFAATEWWCRFSGPLGWGVSHHRVIDLIFQQVMTPALVPEENHRKKNVLERPWNDLGIFWLSCISKICCVVAPPEREEKASETQVQLGQSLQGSWNHRPLLWRKTTKAINGKLGPQDAFTAGQREILAASAAQEIQEVQKNFKKPQLPMPSRSFHCPCGSKEPR